MTREEMGEQIEAFIKKAVVEATCAQCGKAAFLESGPDRCVCKTKEIQFNFEIPEPLVPLLTAMAQKDGLEVGEYLGRAIRSGIESMAQQAMELGYEPGGGEGT